MVMPAALANDLRDAIRRRSALLQARRRLAEALTAIALDIVGEDESLTPDERAWLAKALDAPVGEATEEALSVLSNELERALRDAPGRTRPTLARTYSVRRTDFE
jgi:hypothetical protein